MVGSVRRPSIHSMRSTADDILNERMSFTKQSKSDLLTERCIESHRDLWLATTSLNPFFNALAQDQVPPKKLMYWINQHRMHARIAFIKLLGHTLAKVTTLDERNFPHEHDSFDLICEGIESIHQSIDFTGHLLLELEEEDENDAGNADICFNEGAHETMNYSPENWASIDFLLAAASDATVGECLFIIWTLAQLYHDNWTIVKQKMIDAGTYPESPEDSDLEHSGAQTPINPTTTTTAAAKTGDLDRQLVAGLWGSDLTPVQKMVAHWTSEKFGSFVARLATNVQGYVDELKTLDERVAFKLFERTLLLESKVWPQVCNTSA